MDIFVDHYETLQVHHSAEQEVIKAAYRKLAEKYHPDRNPSPAAHEKMKRINVAYSVLSDIDKRKQYDIEWLQKKENTDNSTVNRASTKPRPVFDPEYIKFKNVKASEIKAASFLIFNAGGPYSKIRINSSESWLIITDYKSLTQSDELPLKVNIQALATKWNTTYYGSIIIELDESKSILPVEIKTRMKLPFRDHKWHDMDFENLRDWVKTPQNKAKLDAGEEIPGKIFRYRYNMHTRKYQVRLRYSHKTGIYETP